MEQNQSSMNVAKIILLSSVFTTLLVLGILFIVRNQIAHMLVSESGETSYPQTVPAINTSDTELVNMVAAVNSAVVSVVVSKDMPIYEQYYEQLDPWGMFSVPRVRENGSEQREVGGGSGFIVSNDGMVVTNNHVVDDETAIYSIVLTDGMTYTVDVLDRDRALDIAILKINEPIESALTYLDFGDSSTLKLGQTVVAIGNALAEFQNSVSVGVVSGLSRSIVASDSWGRTEQLEQVIQTDAAINPGNSGGPLLSLAGKVVGVNVATSRGADNIAFALPSQIVQQAVISVKEHGEIVRPFLGVRYTPVTESLAKANNLPVSYGALIAGGQTEEELAVMPGSPADKADIQEHDIILSIDGEDLKHKDLATILRTKTVGQSITLKVLSKGEEKILTLTLEKASE